MNRILVVDDEPSIRHVIRLALSQFHLEVQEAPDAQSAMAIINQWPPDLILLDYHLPDINGKELAERIKAFTSSPVIMLSGSDQREPWTSGSLIHAYLPKPFKLAELIATVQRFLPTTDIS